MKSPRLLREYGGARPVRPAGERAVGRKRRQNADAANCVRFAPDSRQGANPGTLQTPRPELLSDPHSEFARLPEGIRAIEKNGLTDSITIHHEPQVADHSKFPTLLRERSYFIGLLVAASNYSPNGLGAGTELGLVVATKVAKMLAGQAVETAIVGLATGLL